MDEISTEQIILSNLCLDEKYARQVSPYLKEEYFWDDIEKNTYILIKKYFDRFNNLPNKTTLLHEITQLESSEKIRLNIKNYVNSIFSLERPSNFDWLLQQTETFCRDKSVYNSVTQFINVADGTDTTLTHSGALELLKESIGVCFDSKIGTDILDDAEDLFSTYIDEAEKIPFDLKLLNDITNGGVERKTLNLLVASVNSGKSLGLVHLASSYIKQGYNVMYFTLEMSEKAIAKRIHGNLLNTSINSFSELGRERFNLRIERLKSKSYGKLKIKEFGTGSASVLHFKNTLNDLKTKKNFTPDVILVDYLGITASSKIKVSSGTNTNTYQKYVAEELRDLAFEYNAACFSAVQLNRSGMSDTDFDMTDVADSIAVTTVADFMLGIVRTEELDAMGQVLMKQLKNRYGSKTTNIRFVSGVDLEKQQWFDVNDAEQENIIQEQALFNTKPTNLKNKFSSMDN